MPATSARASAAASTRAASRASVEQDRATGLSWRGRCSTAVETPLMKQIRGHLRLPASTVARRVALAARRRRPLTAIVDDLVAKSESSAQSAKPGHDQKEGAGDCSPGCARQCGMSSISHLYADWKHPAGAEFVTALALRTLDFQSTTTTPIDDTGMYWFWASEKRIERICCFACAPSASPAVPVVVYRHDRGPAFFCRRHYDEWRTAHLNRRH